MNEIYLCHFSQQQLRCLCLGPLKGLFELIRCPSRAMNLSWYIDMLRNTKITLVCSGRRFSKTLSMSNWYIPRLCVWKKYKFGHLYSPLCHTKFGLVKRESLPGARWASSENCQTFEVNDPQIAVLFPSSQKTSINWTILWNKKDGLEYINIFCHNFAWSWSNFAVKPSHRYQPKLNL